MLELELEIWVWLCLLLVIVGLALQTWVIMSILELQKRVDHIVQKEEIEE